MTTTEAPTALELADRFIAALEAGDEATVRDCYAADAVIWHNFDGIEQSVDDNVASLHWLRSVLSDCRYDIVRRELLPDGFLQQHVLRGTAKSGKEVAMPACVVVRVDEGRITRLDEYLDPTPANRYLMGN